MRRQSWRIKVFKTTRTQFSNVLRSVQTGTALLMIPAAGGPNVAVCISFLSLGGTLLGDHNVDTVGGDVARFRRKRCK